MKKPLYILRLLITLSLSFFSLGNALAASLIIEVPDNPEPTTETVIYQCDTGINKERVEATYHNADNISLVDFKWKGDRIIAANVIAASGAKYVGEQYIWWEKNKEVMLYDLINDPEEKKPILCKDETTLLF
ncbi:MliC family protein [Bartonella raoultii]|uniref:MliC family protein n=1 Tax=Bartonella raoultii TaxID=1457020 RepID=A0ABS7I8Q8_9HYPH|nr:MliC family protein [Bartonella raoultii]MBX4335979.1 MliC family protein [Bartonella raoultii]